MGHYWFANKNQSIVYNWIAGENVILDTSEEINDLLFV